MDKYTQSNVTHAQVRQCSTLIFFLKCIVITSSYHIFLKELATQLSKPLTLIFNNSLRLGKLPTDWKNCQITAIYKKGENVYRPVSLTSVVAKIIRDHAHNELLSKYFFFTNKQFGLRYDDTIFMFSISTNYIVYINYVYKCIISV